VDAVFYWDMTYAEIKTTIESNQKRIKEEMQAQASIAYKLGELIGIAFNEPEKYPALKNAFPKLFDDIQEIPDKQQDWRVMKARIEQYNSLYKQQKRGESS
jgi:hypothetical protein